MSNTNNNKTNAQAQAQESKKGEIKMIKTTVTETSTKKDKFNALVELIGQVELDGTVKTILTDFINHEIELLEKKAQTKSKATIEKEKADSVLRTEVIKVLKAKKDFCSINEIQADSEKLKGLNTSKMTALLLYLMKEGKVERKFEKKKATFKING